MATTFQDIARNYQQGLQLRQQRELSLQKIQKQEQHNKSISDYLQSPNQQTLSRIASNNPQAANSIMAVNKMHSTNQARKVRALHNTWQKVPISQRSSLYTKWRKENQEDMEDYPIEYNEKTASDIDFLLNQDNEQARLVLGEKPEKAVSPQGKLLEDVEAGRVPKYIARRKLQAEQPIQVAPETAQIQDLNQRADVIESVGEQNINQGNVKIGNQQLKKSRALRKEFKEGEKLIERDVQKLSATLNKSGIVDLVNTLEDISSTINTYPDIPGAGKGAFVPAFALDIEGKILRQSVASLRNSILKARSGGAVTPSEARRLLEELGSGAFKTDEQLRIGIQKVIERFQNNLGNIKGGFRPDAVTRLAERTGSSIFDRMNALNIDIGGEQAPTAEEIQAEIKRRKLK